MKSSHSISLLDILMRIIIGIVSLVSLLGNGFITAVQGYQWLQNRKMMPCDLLLTSLSTSRFVMQLQSLVNYLLDLINSETYMDSYTEAALYVIWIFLNMSSLWSATWLSVFYCVKVTNFANCLFLWLKPRINVLTPRLLGMSILIFSIFSVPSVIEYLEDTKLGNLTGTPSENATQSEVYKKKFSILFPLQITCITINFSIGITASTLLLVSLWKHTRNLKKSSVGGKDLSTQVHINVITPLMFYVFLYLLYFSSVMIRTNKAVKFGRSEKLFLDIMMSTFPSAHSMILIWTNPKLKEMAVRILNIRQRT